MEWGGWVEGGVGVGGCRVVGSVGSVGECRGVECCGGVVVECGSEGSERAS